MSKKIKIKINKENFEKLKKKGKSGLFNLIFSRTAIILTLLIVEFFILFVVLNKFGNHIYTLLGSSRLISVIMITYLLNDEQDPTVKISWIIVILVFPILGSILYIYIFTDIGHRIVKNRVKLIDEKTKNIIKQDSKVIDDLIENKEYEIYNIHNYLDKINGNKIYKNTNIKYFKDGESMFSEFLHRLKQAKKFIFMEYFIISKGYMWDKILDVLKDKVEEGVDVRIIYDGTCSFLNLPYNYAKELSEIGIKAKVFSQIKPFISTHYNNRDHRKITVIDGVISFNGGINIADEYINKIERFGYWKDTAVMLEGDATKEFTRMFLRMWHLNDMNIENEELLEYIDISSNIKNDSYIMPYDDNPFDNELVAENVYVDFINNAKRYLYITTPYFITDNVVIEALKLSSKKGVDVALILPNIPDKKIPFALAHTYYEELAKAGIKIYQYTPGFIHSKMFLSDDNKAIVGTINLDYRSLYHHFECATYIYKDKVIEDIKTDFLEIMKISELQTLEKIQKNYKIIKIWGRLLKLIAPLI